MPNILVAEPETRKQRLCDTGVGGKLSNRGTCVKCGLASNGPVASREDGFLETGQLLTK
jgi:hypothetical protein